MRVILICPWTKTVEEKTIAGGDAKVFAQLIELLAPPTDAGHDPVTYIDSVGLPGGDRLWVDDMGLSKDYPTFHPIGLYHQPLAGRGVVVNDERSDGPVLSPHKLRCATVFGLARPPVTMDVLDLTAMAKPTAREICALGFSTETFANCFDLLVEQNRKSLTGRAMPIWWQDSLQRIESVTIARMMLLMTLAVMREIQITGLDIAEIVDDVIEREKPEAGGEAVTILRAMLRLRVPS